MDGLRRIPACVLGTKGNVTVDLVRPDDAHRPVRQGAPPLGGIVVPGRAQIRRRDDDEAMPGGCARGGAAGGARRGRGREVRRERKAARNLDRARARLHPRGPAPPFGRHAHAQRPRARDTADAARLHGPGGPDVAGVEGRVGEGRRRRLVRRAGARHGARRLARPRGPARDGPGEARKDRSVGHVDEDGHLGEGGRADGFDAHMRVLPKRVRIRAPNARDIHAVRRLYDERGAERRDGHPTHRISFPPLRP